MVSSIEMTHYRKRIIARMPSLGQLDGDMILQGERSRAEAFDAAYVEAVRKELGGAAGEEAAQAECELRLRWSNVQSGARGVDGEDGGSVTLAGGCPIVYVSRELRKSVEAAAHEAERAAALSVAAARRAEEDDACDVVLRMLEEAEKALPPEELAEEREIEARYLAAAEAEMSEDVSPEQSDSDSMVGWGSAGSKQSTTCASAHTPAVVPAPMAALPPPPPPPETARYVHAPPPVAARAAPASSATTAEVTSSAITTAAVTTDFEALD